PSGAQALRAAPRASGPAERPGSQPGHVRAAAIGPQEREGREGGKGRVGANCKDKTFGTTLRQIPVRI
ncbi:hypothetical protein MC885_006323, partial [Smutsia gigantea]